MKKNVIITATTAALMGFAAPAFAQDAVIEAPEGEVNVDAEAEMEAPSSDDAIVSDEDYGMGGPDVTA
ncbi:MAG: hypothetical protein WA979_13940, partial [Pacificimonas sp.]